MLGAADSDRAVNGALEHGRSYVGQVLGQVLDRNSDKRDLEFVLPITLHGQRYALVSVYDHRVHDARLHEERDLLAVIGLLALLGGGGVFYLVGGRRLMRDHRVSLGRATRDGLTNLSNQRAFQDEFPAAVAAAARYRDPLALALLDIDDFKLINDRQGHLRGDEVLKWMSETLAEVRPGDRPYRLGGDEFALVLSHTDEVGVGVLARRLCRDCAEAGVPISVGVSAVRPGVQADILRAEADAALYEAKRKGGNGSAHFDDLGEHMTVSPGEKKEAVRRLIDEGRLTTDFQPIWDIGAESLLGVEALSRPDPSYGLSGPAEAFDIAEQIGRVHQLDVLCVESALRSVPELEPGALLFINLSPLTLDLDAGARDWLAPAVEQAGMAPRSVVVEVTERYGGRMAAIAKQVQRLHDQGFKIAVDDVGMGNSGLGLLRAVDAEYVKIDQSIVRASLTEPGALAVLMAMATFARQTGAFVIAEGIEDEDVLRFLRKIDGSRLESEIVIQGGQGYGLGRPAPHVPLQPPAMLQVGPRVGATSRA